MIVHKSFLVLIGCIFLFSISEAKQKSAPKDYKIAPGEIVVKFKENSSSNGVAVQSLALTQVQSKFGLTAAKQLFTGEAVLRKPGSQELARIFVFSVPSATDIEALSRRVAADPMVEYAEPHYYFKLHAVPNDPLYAQIYPLAVVKADSAWELQKGDSTVVIGIIDSGVDWDHPDLASIIWSNTDEIPGNGIDDDGNGYIDDIRGWDFVASIADGAASEDASIEDNNPMDFNGHGTHVSGIAAGATNNGIGIASLGWGCRIMPLRAGWHSTDGNGYVSSLYASKAYVYAAQNGASVCNQSSGTSEVVLDGALYAFKNGVVITNSAGNSNADESTPLGSQPWALSVAATNSADGKASYSTYNSSVDICAPGGDFNLGNRQGFLSTVVNPSAFFNNSLYTEFQGTSMASPFVAALAGLVKSKNKSWSPSQVMFQITGTADNIDAVNPSYAGKLGFGRINALRALKEPPVVPKPNLEFVSYSLSDVTGGNGNGIAEPGENLKVTVTVRNLWGDAQNLNAQLTSNHWSVSITKSAASYGLLRGISNLDSNQRGNTSDEFGISLSANAIPEVIPFTVSFTASGGYVKEFHFDISPGAGILLVDDDDGTTNVESFYTSALKKLGISYDMWNHAQNGTPSASLLQNYTAVIWSCEWAFPSLDSSDRASLAAYLDGGGVLFLSGQDIGWDLSDAGGATIPNEYGVSGGASNLFFEKYLKAHYEGDDAVTQNVSGVDGDTIGHNLGFQRFQPFRSSDNQYPDAVDTTGGSTFSFLYSDGPSAARGAAVKYSGSYKLLYFAFGGFESISDSVKRLMVMDRIVKWMFEFNLVTAQLPNTENTVNPYIVTSKVASKHAVQSADLYWDTDGQLPFNKVAMTNQNGSYAGSIPAQPNNSSIEYFVLVRTSAGYLPFTRYSFYVGIDTVKPVIVLNDTIDNSLDLNGPFGLLSEMSDDIGIDSASAKIHYRVNTGSEQTVVMVKNQNGKYAGSIIPSSALASGDRIAYYITVQDSSSQKNTGRYPLTDEKQFVVGREVIDNFENPSAGKWNPGLWNYTTKQKYSGMYSFTDSPDSTYPANSERTALLVKTFDLTSFTKGLLTFYHRHNIHTTDTVYVELSSNGIDWLPVKKLTGVNLFWKKEMLDIAPFIGGTNASVSIRMRLKSDGADQNDGIYIDNMELLTDQFTVTSVNPGRELPRSFSLSQNFPNPFNPVTTIRYEIPHDGFVSMKVFDILGREIATLLNEPKQAGSYSLSFDASSLSSGVYFYRLASGSFAELKKMTVIK